MIAPTAASPPTSFGGRITRRDFPPPRELADRDPAAAPAEHVGGLRAELRLKDGAVRLGRTYYQNPLRAIAPVIDRPGGPALLYLMNSTAGLLDGDGQLVDLDIGPNVRAFVTNQSAGRVHPCPLLHAAARYEARVAPGATLCLLPGPTIPFAGSRFHQRVELHLAAGAGLVWGDILLAGRTAYRKGPERFAFDRFIQELRIRREGRLVHHERLDWRGPWDDAQARWHFGGADAAALLFITGALPAELTPSLPGGAVVVAPTAHGDTCVRLLGGDAEAVIAAAAVLALRAAAHLAGDPAPWFVGSSGLSEAHWFSPLVAANAFVPSLAGSGSEPSGGPPPVEPGPVRLVPCPASEDPR